MKVALVLRQSQRSFSPAHRSASERRYLWAIFYSIFILITILIPIIIDSR